MKYLITLLIMVTPLVANGQGILATAADTGNIDVGFLVTNAISVNDLWWGADSIMTDIGSFPVKHDTTKEYVKEIADKCDTTWGKHWVKYKKIDGEQYFKRMARVDSVYCYVDSVWAKKQAVYLTPKEMERLRKLVD